MHAKAIPEDLANARAEFYRPADAAIPAVRDTILFSFSDRPVQQALGLWRKKKTDWTPWLGSMKSRSAWLAE